MLPTYTKEQLWKLYDKLPPELQEAIFSEENAEHIATICQRYGIEENKISEVAKIVGRVFLGLLAPEAFSDVLEKEAGLKKETAQLAGHEINRFVFAPVKDFLAQIYRTGTVQAQPVVQPIEGTKPITPPAEAAAPKTAESKPEKPKSPAEKADTYREILE